MSDEQGYVDLRSALKAAGTVGRDLLAVNWNATPLASPEKWPASLVTVVRAVLVSRFSMWMAWGPDLTFFCNDAYRIATLGTKYPWALGRPASEVWEEIWPDIGPRIEHVIRTGEATWDESLLLFLERSGYVEETYHTFSYSPLSGDDGQTAGMLCVVTEDTERVIGDYDMATLRDLGLETTGAADEADFLASACLHLSANRRSLPFSLIYLFEDGGEIARRAGSTGIADGDPPAPSTIASADRDAVWPLTELRNTDAPVLVEGLAERFAELPTGDWDEPPTQALMLPLPNQGRRGDPYGFIVVGLNRYRALDADYRSFLSLVAAQLAAGIARVRAYDAERRRAEQLAELDTAKTTFFTNVSHELRTPLTLLLGPAYDALADTEQSLPPAQRARTEVIARNADRLLKLVNELLDFSRLESGTVNAHFEPLNLPQYTAELATLFRPAVEQVGLELHVDCRPMDSALFVDREMWAKIVLNLLSNALKFTFEGSITLALERSGDAVVLRVSDTGIGIEPADQKHLFERFHRVSGARSRSHEGSGIGLALVAELAALHGGTPSVESTPGRGSTFSIEIPLSHLRSGPTEAVQPTDVEFLQREAHGFLSEIERWRHEESEIEQPDRDVRPRKAAAPGRSRVLVVDDNADMRDYLASLLDERYTVQSAPDGARALQMVRESAPDLIISDAMMPGLDGFELVAELRANPETQPIPIIMVSARAGEEGTIEGLEAGADDYLVKPFSARELLARVSANLELARLRRQATEHVDAERWRLEAVLEQLPAGVVLVDAPSGRQIMANQQVSEILGHQPLVDGIENRGELRGYNLEGEPLAPEHYPITRSLRDGEVVRNEDMIYEASTGRRLVIRVNSAPVRDRAGTVIAAVSVFQDVTERVRAERLLSAQRDTLALIAAGAPLSETLERLVLSVEMLLESDSRASIMLASDDRRRLEGAAAPNLPAAYNEAVDGIEVGPEVGSCGTAAHRGQTVIVADIETDPLWKDYRELALAHGLRACWSTPIQSSGGQVIGTFAVYYDRTASPSDNELAAVQLMARTAAVAIERDRTQTALLTQFADLQKSLLPPQLPHVPGVHASASFRPGNRTVDVGGDFYDLFVVAPDSWAFMIGDVCGHGTEAAAATAIARHTARAVALQGGDPSEVLIAVNRALLHSGFDRFATMIFGCLSVTDSRTRISLCRAGHPSPIVVRRDGTLEEVEGHGPALGIYPEITAPLRSVELGPEEALVMYTDGVTERNPRIDQEAGLAPMLQALAGRQADAILSGLEAGVIGTQALRDDAAIFVLSNAVHAASPTAHLAPPPPLRLTRPAVAETVPETRRAIATYAAGIVGATDPLLERIRLAVSEAVTNVVLHAYGEAEGMVRVSVGVDGNKLDIAVLDDGCGYLKPTEHAGLGMGLSVIADACDAFTIAERAGGGTEARMRFLVAAAELARPM
jgi:PAS domain S-box-containing protein